jgi:hypothetical protein
MNTGPEIAFDSLLGHTVNEALCERLAHALEDRQSGLVFIRSEETGTALSLLLAEGVVIHWQAVGPVNRDQARVWADSVRESFCTAAAAPPELH